MENFKTNHNNQMKGKHLPDTFIARKARPQGKCTMEKLEEHEHEKKLQPNE